MLPELVGNNVRARCPDCDGAVSSFEFQEHGKEFGYISVEKAFEGRVMYRLLRCAGCHRGGLAKLVDTGPATSALVWFLPISPERARLPDGVPQDIEAEVREAETCIGCGAYRAASALFRSALEKTLKANGYTDSGSLQDKINRACEDGVITAARRERAHEEVRVLGNDVLHDEWRNVTAEEATLAHHYVQRVLEDFYDDRESTERVLRKAKRIT
jgi:hypothetical protein